MSNHWAYTFNGFIIPHAASGWLGGLLDTLHEVDVLRWLRDVVEQMLD